MTKLPTATRDVELAKREMDEFGYTLIADALTPDQVAAMRNRLFEQALCEAELRGESLAIDDETSSAFVQSCVNKGREWRAALDPFDEVHQVLEHVFTPAFDPFIATVGGLKQKYIASSIGAKFKHRDVVNVLTFHIDQRWSAGHHDYPLVATVFYMLTDFTVENGCTYVVPGSHKIPAPSTGTVNPGEPPMYRSYEDVAPDVTRDAIPVEGRAGTAFIFEGRTWHSAGVNTSGELRAHLNGFYCAPYVRQREMYAMNLRQDVVEELTEAQLSLLGFDTVLQGDGDVDGLFGIIEPTLGRNNLTTKHRSIGELHNPTPISV